MKKLEELLPLYIEAKKELKKIKGLDLYDDELLFPLYNDIRYAGRHIINALELKIKDEKNKSIQTEELERARNHLFYVKYIANMLNMSHNLYVFKEFENRFRKLTIEKVISDWDNYLTRYDKIKKIFDALPERQDPQNLDWEPAFINASYTREEEYDILTQLTKELTGINERLDRSRNGLIASEYKQRLDDAIKVIGLVLGAASLFFSIASLSTNEPAKLTSLNYLSISKEHSTEDNPIEIRKRYSKGHSKSKEERSRHIEK